MVRSNNRGATDNCYVDQASTCDEPNSVPCNDLEENTIQACCPRLTSCQPGFEASESLVRCNILYRDLIAAAAGASSSTTSTTSTTSSSPTTSPTSQSQTSQSSSATQTPTSVPAPEHSGSTLSGGAIGGISVGATLAFVAALFGGYKLYQRRRKNGVGAQGSPYPNDVQSPKPPSAYYTGGGQVVYEQVPPGYGYTPAEMMNTPPAELDGTR